MWHYLKLAFDSRSLCVVTRPIAGLVIAGVVAGVCGLLGGFAHGAFHDSPQFAIVGGLRLAGAGAVAGFIMGLWSGSDRMKWPEDECGGPKKPSRLLPLVKVNSESPRQPIRTTLSGTRLPEAVVKKGNRATIG
jgi:hypothetical protein